MPTPTATVIVPTARGGERLRGLLISLGDGGGVPPQVTVVDNASGDPRMARLAEEFPGVSVLPMGENAGFGRAVNSAARRSDSDVIVLVNDDCVCDPGFAGALAAHIDPGAGVTMAAGVLREARDPSLIDTAGVEVDRTLLAFDYLNGEPVSLLDVGGIPDPLGPCGGAAAYDRSAFLEAGGFDEAIFAFLEDVDLALRLRLAGQRCALAGDARATHEHSGTLGPGSARKNRLMGFGRGYLLRKYGVLTPRRAPGVLFRDAVVCAGQLAFDRNAAGVAGRLEGWRAARRAHPYPRSLIESFGPPSAASTLKRRAARRSRLRSASAARPVASDDGPPASTREPRGLRAMAVLHVAEVSGPALSLEDRLRRLTEAGSLDVVVPGDGPAAELYGEFARIHVRDYEALMLPRGPLSLAATAARLRSDARMFGALLREVRPQLVVVATAMLPAAQIAARREGVPVALEASELLTSGRAGPRRLAGRALVRTAGRRAHAVFACSRAVAAEYAAAGISATVIYPPIEDRYAGGDGAAFRRRNGIDPDAPLILCAASITRRRGQDLAIEAVRRLRQELPAVCALVGVAFPRAQDIEFERELRTLAAAAGPGVVTLAGYEPHMADAYAAADVVVNPATGPEAFGRVACEALAAGRPVVSTRTGASAEVLRDGETALLVPPGDPGELADAIAALLRDQRHAATLAERGRADVLRRFTAAEAWRRFSPGIAAALEDRRGAPA